VKRRYGVVSEPSAAADVWGVMEYELYKMWALLLIAVIQGKRG
jgi:hypothetical protein